MLSQCAGAYKISSKVKQPGQTKSKFLSQITGLVGHHSAQTLTLMQQVHSLVDTLHALKRVGDVVLDGQLT